MNQTGTKEKRKRKNRQLGAKTISLRLFAGLFAAFWLVVAGTPYFYLVITSLKNQGEFLSGGSFSLPHSPTLQNYAEVLKGNFFHYLGNSTAVLVVSLLLLLGISACAAYPLARMKFRLNRPIYGIIIAAMSVPIHITLIPMFSMAVQTGLYDTIWALVGPYVAFNLPVSVFILTAFMQSIPPDIEQAAEIDGCGRYKTFLQMILPLSTSGLATLAIYNGVSMWNEFSFAMVLTQSQPNRTLPLAVWEYQGQYTMNIPLVMTVLALSSVPIILLYILGQDKLIKGMMAGAVKG